MDDDMQIELEFLFANPPSLVFLCFTGDTLYERQPSRAIVKRGMECIILQERGLTEQIADKHLHERPCILTTLGKKVLARLCELGIPEQIYQLCNLVDRAQCELDIANIIEDCTKSLKPIPDIWFLEGFPTLGVKLERNCSKGLAEFVPMDVEVIGENAVLIFVEIICPKCKNNSEFKYNISEETFFNFIRFDCPFCSTALNFSHDLSQVY